MIYREPSAAKGAPSADVSVAGLYAAVSGGAGITGEPWVDTDGVYHDPVGQPDDDRIDDSEGRYRNAVADVAAGSTHGLLVALTRNGKHVYMGDGRHRLAALATAGVDRVTIYPDRDIKGDWYDLDRIRAVIEAATPPTENPAPDGRSGTGAGQGG